MSVTGFDAGRLYEDLAWEVATRGITWNDVARESGVARPAFTRMSWGGSPDLHNTVKLLEWLGHPHGLHKYLITEEDEEQ